MLFSLKTIQILLMNNSKTQDPDYVVALNSMEKLFNEMDLEMVNSSHQRTDLRKKTHFLTDRYKKVKIDTLKQVYIEKMKQNNPYGQPVDVTISKNYVTPKFMKIKGIGVNKHFYSFLILINLLCFILMSYLSSFTGFIIGFAQNQSTEFAPVFIKALCTFVFGLVFVIRSIRRRSNDGQDLKYIFEIIRQYWREGRLLIDFITFVYGIVFLCLPKVPGVGMAYFFIIWASLAFSARDIIHLEANYLSSQRQKLMIGLVKIFVLNFLFAHFNANILLGMARLDLQESWLSVNGHLDGPWFEQYIYAFYWGTTIMMTVGFGDYLPVTQKETIIVSIIEIVSCVVLAYNISQIGNIIGQLREAHEKVSYKRAVFNRMIQRDHKSAIQIIDKQQNKVQEMYELKKNESSKNRAKTQRQIRSKYAKKISKIQKEKHLDRKLEQKIFNYINQLGIAKSNLRYVERKQFLEELPQQLREQYLQIANKRLFMRVLFFGKLKQSTLERLASKFTDQMLYPGSYIPVQSTDFMILDEGTVGFAYYKKGASLNGEIMEEMSVKRNQNSVLITNAMFYMKERPKYQICSLDYAIIFRLSFETFLEEIQSSKMDHQYYFNILHKHLYNTYDWQFKKCERCKNSYHTIFHCYKTSYIPLRSLIVLKRFVKSGFDQLRKTSFRRRMNQYKKKSPWKHRKNLFNVLESQIVPAKHMSFNSMREKQQQKFSFSKSFEEGDMKNFAQTQAFKNIVIQAVRYYQTGYSDEFWGIESDQAHNYQFYFTHSNSSRLLKTPIHKIISHNEANKVKRNSMFSDPRSDYKRRQVDKSRSKIR